MAKEFEQSVQAAGGSTIEARRLRRWYVDFQSELAIAHKRFACQVCDLSPGGACVAVTGRVSFGVGSRLKFILPGYGEIPAEVVYVLHGDVGLKFRHDGVSELAVARYLVQVDEKQQKSGETPVPIEATFSANGSEINCLVTNMSAASARIIVGDVRNISPGQKFPLILPGRSHVEAIVKRVDDWEIEVALIGPPAAKPTLDPGNVSWLKQSRAENSFAVHKHNKTRRAGA